MTKTGGRVALVVFACAGTALTAQQPQPPHKPDHMEHRFDDPAEYAKSFDDPARDAWQMPARIIDTLALSPTASVADIGSGTGYFTVRLAKAVPRGAVYTVDIEPAMLEHVRKRAAAEKLWRTSYRPVNRHEPEAAQASGSGDRRRYLPSPAEPLDLLRDLRKSLAPAAASRSSTSGRTRPRDRRPSSASRRTRSSGRWRRRGNGSTRGTTSCRGSTFWCSAPTASPRAFCGLAPS